MKTIRFLDDFVEAILSGKKTSTIRQNTNRIPAVGEYVRLSSKEQPDFATAFIKYVDRKPVISQNERRALKSIYGDRIDNICRVHFVVHSKPDST